MLSLLASSILIHAVTAAPSADAIVRVKDRDALVRALDEAGPGTQILLAPGSYRGGIRHAGLAGKAGKPVVLAAALEEFRAAQRANAERPDAHVNLAGLHARFGDWVELASQAARVTLRPVH